MTGHGATPGGPRALAAPRPARTGRSTDHLPGGRRRGRVPAAVAAEPADPASRARRAPTSTRWSSSNPGDVIIFSFDYEPDTMAELDPMSLATLRHAFRKDCE